MAVTVRLALSDEDLLALAADGDERALAALYDRHGRTAFGVARRVLGDRRLAEDAVQEAFLQLWRFADRYSAGRSTVLGWLLVLVHRRAVDLVRRERLRRPVAAEAYEEAAAESSEEEVWRRLERERVRGALQRLSEEHRMLLELAYYGGLTQSELAERLGQPLGTVKSRTFAALARLRGLLEEGADRRDETAIGIR